jgi:hypothetical protein
LTLDLESSVVFYRAAFQTNLRDVRRLPGGGWKSVLYHVGIYLGRTDVPLDRFRPQASEIVALRYHTPAELDRLLVAGQLAPNMAFTWLAHGRRALGLARKQP